MSLSAQIARKFPSQRDFSKNGRVAQLAEHSALNRQVEGSIPSASTNYIYQLGRFASALPFDTGENTKDPASILLLMLSTASLKSFREKWP